MNKIKTLLLGTAALTVAATGAQAADPIFDVKAPREPVYRCDITGFIELPGTDVCFKVGGYARLVATAGSKYFSGTRAVDINPLPFRNVGGATVLSYGNVDNGFSMYGQGRINFDARTATEYGTVRAFIEMQASDNGTNSGGAFGLRHAFVQFGNWTFGKTWSTFYPGFSVANYADAYTTVGDNFLRTTQIRYTQAFGGGFTVSLAIENPGYGEDAPGASLINPAFVDPAATGLIVIDDRDEVPVFVAALGASGAWGQAQLAGLVLRNETRDWQTGPGGIGLPGSTDSEIGWGVSFGLALNVPTGPGDAFLFNATYTDGASQYHVSSGAGLFGMSTIWGNTAAVADVFNNSITDTVQAWSVSAAYQHFWTPTVNTSLGGGYTSTDFGSGFAFATPLVVADVTQIDAWDAFANIEWTPVNNLAFLLEGRYSNIDYDGAITGPGFDFSDEDAFSVTFQATRSF